MSSHTCRGGRHAIVMFAGNASPGAKNRATPVMSPTLTAAGLGALRPALVRPPNMGVLHRLYGTSLSIVRAGQLPEDRIAETHGRSGAAGRVAEATARLPAFAANAMLRIRLIHLTTRAYCEMLSFWRHDVARALHRGIYCINIYVSAWKSRVIHAMHFTSSTQAADMHAVDVVAFGFC